MMPIVSLSLAATALLAAATCCSTAAMRSRAYQAGRPVAASPASVRCKNPRRDKIPLCILNSSEKCAHFRVAAPLLVLAEIEFEILRSILGNIHYEPGGAEGGNVGRNQPARRAVRRNDDLVASRRGALAVRHGLQREAPVGVGRTKGVKRRAALGDVGGERNSRARDRVVAVYDHAA